MTEFMGESLRNPEHSFNALALEPCRQNVRGKLSLGYLAPTTALEMATI